MLLDYMDMNGSYILLSENFVGEKLGSKIYRHRKIMLQNRILKKKMF